MKALDLTGQKFGKLTAKNVTHIGKKRAWHCVCECGNEIDVPTFQLTSGNNTSCGCGRSKVSVGQRFGKLTVLEVRFDKKAKRDDKLQALVRCDCGEEKLVFTRNLTRGVSTHCGCKIYGIRSENKRLPYGESSRRALISNYKHNAKTRNLSFELTDDECTKLFKGNCHYCGEKPSREYKHTPNAHGSYVYNGIDRLDSSKGYEAKNVVSCCSDCNYFKREYPEEKFLSMIKKIAAHRKLL